MIQELAHIVWIVSDYDDSIKFYTEQLNFVLEADTVLSESKRWVVVLQKVSTGCNLLLAKATNEEQ